MLWPCAIGGLGNIPLVRQVLRSLDCGVRIRGKDPVNPSWYSVGTKSPMFAYFKGQHEAGFRQHVRSRLRECARAVACVVLVAVLPAGAASVNDYTHTDRLIVRLKGQSATDTARASPMTQSDRYRRLASELLRAPRCAAS